MYVHYIIELLLLSLVLFMCYTNYKLKEMNNEEREYYLKVIQSLAHKNKE